MRKILGKVAWALLGTLLLGWGAVLLWRFFPMNHLVWPPLAAACALAFLLALWRPVWACALLLFLSPWLTAVPLLATGGQPHPMHVFVLFFCLAGLSYRELLEKEGVGPFRGSLGYYLWLGAILVGVWGSFSRYAPEWVFSNGAFWEQAVNEKGWDRIRALTYLAFNASTLIGGLLLVPFAHRMGVREERRGGDILKLLFRLWLFFAAGATLAIAVAFFQRHSIEFCASRSFYWVKMGRVNGTCQDPNALGIMLCLAAMWGLSFLGSWRRERGRRWLFLLPAWLVVCCLGINCSGSRSGLLGIVLLLLLLLAGALVNTRAILPARPLVRLGICLLALGLLAGGAGLGSMALVGKADKMLKSTTKSPALQRRLKKDLRSIKSAGTISRIFNDARRQLYPRYAREVAEYAWPCGVGVGSFVTELPNFAFYDEENLRIVDNACNTYLQVKAETGIFGGLGLGLFMLGFFGSFAGAWFKWRGEGEVLRQLWTVAAPAAVFAVLLILGVHLEALEVSIPWHVMLGCSCAFLTLRSERPFGLHREAKVLGALLVLALLLADLYCVNRLNRGDMNSERRRASIGKTGTDGFREMEYWGSSDNAWRWCGREGVMCLQKLNSRLSFDLVSNCPGLTGTPQRVTVYLNGSPETNVTLSAPGQIATVTLATGYPLPFDALTDQHLSLRLSCEHVWRPCDYGTPGDERELGVAMGRLRWLPDDRPEAGFYEREKEPDGRVFAWSGGAAFFSDRPRKWGTLEISLKALNPMLRFREVTVAIYVNGHFLDVVHLGDHNWRTYEYELPDDVPKKRWNLVELFVSRCWLPRHYGFEDGRSLGVAVSVPCWQEESADKEERK